MDATNLFVRGSLRNTFAKNRRSKHWQIFLNEAVPRFVKNQLINKKIDKTRTKNDFFKVPDLRFTFLLKMNSFTDRFQGFTFLSEVSLWSSITHF